MKRTALRKCDIHTLHVPVIACSPDWHHVVPRDWQRAWTPPDAKVVTTQQYGPVWDPTGVHVGPTCHRNVHVAIVALVHTWTPALNEGPFQKYVLAARQTLNASIDPSSWATALKALARWQQVGGEVEFLQQNKLWGES